MANLHFYLNGTIGGTDGTEITSLTFKNMYKYMMCNQYQTGTYLYLPIYLRTTAGYKCSNVTVTTITGNYRTSVTAKFPSLDDTNQKDQTDAGSSLNIGDITSTNSLIFLGLFTYYNHDSIAETPMFTFSYVEEVV